jgi:hypothetical protein
MIYRSRRYFWFMGRVKTLTERYLAGQALPDQERPGDRTRRIEQVLVLRSIHSRTT